MKRYTEFVNEQVDWDDILVSYAYNGNLEGVKKALDNGADIHTNKDRALGLSSYTGHFEVVKYLCEWIIQNEPWYIPKIMEYIPEDLKEKYAHLFAANDMDLL